MAMQIISTDIQIGNLKTKDIRFDMKIKDRAGLTLRVYPTGVKSFVTRITCKESGKRRVITLGSHNDGLTISQAAALKGEYKTQGVAAKETSDKNTATAVIEAAKTASKIEDVIDAYYRNQLEGLARPENVIDIFNRFILPELKGKVLVHVEPKSIHAAIAAIKENNGHGAARKASVYFSSFFKWCVSTGEAGMKIDPTASFTKNTFKFKKTIRKRHLSRHEVPLLLKAIDNSGMQERSKIGLKLLMLNGTRSAELLLAEWKHINFEKETWFLPAANTKTSETLTIHLAPQSIALLSRLQELTGRSGLLMGGLARKALTKALTRMQQPNAAGVVALELDKDLTAHDLRRSFTTFLSNMGVPFDIREKMLNHKIQGTSESYDHAIHIEQRKAAAILLADAYDNPLELLPVTQEEEDQQ
ncbi:MAG: integrase [Oleispira sp.]|jgi:integrase